MQQYNNEPVGVAGLSLREIEILQLISKGLADKEIAATLGISHHTSKNHMTTIMRKLGANNRTHAAIIFFSALHNIH